MADVSQFSPVTDRVFVLRIRSSGQEERSGEEIRVTQPITIGRDEGCDIILIDPAVSRRHARLVGTPEGLKVVDLGSGNGVWAGAKRVKELVLTMGDQFRVGSTTFEYFGSVVAEPDMSASSPTMLLPAPVLPGSTPAKTPPLVLEIVDASESASIGTQFELKGSALTIGRSTSSTIV